MVGPRSILLVLAAVLCYTAAPSTANAFVYWANSNQYRVGRADLDGSHAISQLASGMYPCGVASDGTYVYWADPIAGTIGRKRVDGTGQADSMFVAGAQHPCGVAVYGHYLYWANEASYGVSTSIGRVDLRNRLDVRENFVPNEQLTGGSDLDYPCGVAVDATGIYWGDQAANAIGHANLDGTGERTLITGASSPCGVALAHGEIFWANQGSNSIGAAPESGGTANEIITGAQRPCGVAVYSHYIYWINQSILPGGSLTRADLSSPDPTASAQDIVTGLNFPCGVAADGLFQGTLKLGAPRQRRNGTLAIPASVSSAGVVTATQTGSGSRLLRPTHAQATGPGRLTLIMQRTTRPRSAKPRRRTVRVRVTFAATGGLAASATTTATIIAW